MKRNLDLIRSILLETEEKCLLHSYVPLEINGFEQDEIDYHFFILREEGLIMGDFLDCIPNVRRLTWKGHEFLDNAKNPTIWEKTSNLVKEQGGNISFHVLSELLKSMALKQFGLQ